MSGMGKSALAFQIALAAASGDPGGCGLADLGLAVAPGRVIVWAMEDNGGVSLPTLWRWAHGDGDPTFPRPIRLSARVTVWRLADLEAWLAGRPAA